MVEEQSHDWLMVEEQSHDWLMVEHKIELTCSVSMAGGISLLIEGPAATSPKLLCVSGNSWL